MENPQTNNKKNESTIHLWLVPLLLWAIALTMTTAYYYSATKNKVYDYYKETYNFVAADLKKNIEKELVSGFKLYGLSKAQQIIKSSLSLSSNISNVSLYSLEAMQIIFSTKEENIGAKLRHDWLNNKEQFVFNDANNAQIITPITNALGEHVGGLLLDYNFSPATKVVNEALSSILKEAMFYFASGLLLFLLTYFVFFSNSIVDFSRPAIKKIRSLDKLTLGKPMLGLFLNFIIICSGGYLFNCDLQAKYSGNMTPIVDDRGKMLSLWSARKIESMVNLNIPFSVIGDVEDLFNMLMSNNPEISYILVTDNVGHVIYKSGDPAKAFTEKNGKTVLVDGYNNLTEQVRRNATEGVGWVQLGLHIDGLIGGKQ